MRAEILEIKEPLENHLFNFALVTSFLIHLVLFLSFIYTNSKTHRPLYKKMEVVYQSAQEVPQKKSSRAQEKTSVEQRKWSFSPEILSKGQEGGTPLLKDFEKSSTKLEVYEKRSGRVALAEGKRVISVPLLQSEKITNPQYLDYHERIRTKIKNRAYFYVDNPEFKAGEVYLTFVLLSNGSLKDIRINDEKTRANEFLRSVGLRSIKESSPFPAFPPDLKYPELSFHVVISFEVEK